MVGIVRINPALRITLKFLYVKLGLRQPLFAARVETHCMRLFSTPLIALHKTHAMRLYKNIEIPKRKLGLSAAFYVERRDSSLYNRPEGQKVYSQG